MLRQPESLYVIGRSATLLKVKSFKDDEAVVIGHLAGAGRHKGRMGALQVRLADGTEFAIGPRASPTRSARSRPPSARRLSSATRNSTDGGVPRFPSFSAVREE